MSKPPKEDPRLAGLSRVCLRLPEAERHLYGETGHAWFQVRGKKFAYFLNNHHGDGIVSVCFKTVPGQGAVLIDAEPDRFYSPAYIGPKGWVGLRLDRGAIDWEEVADFVTESYRLAAPKRHAALLGRPPS
jgi:predicted DNA-binding protein (MmcQ/YjbR family)